MRIYISAIKLEIQELNDKVETMGQSPRKEK